MINKIQLNNFRNYENVQFETERDIVVLYGENGIGKTNLLEAISLFAYGKGLRRGKFEGMIRNDSAKNFWNVIAQADGYTFSSGYVKDGLSGKRIFRVVDKQTKSLDEFAKNHYILWLTYETDRLFLQSPSDRRSFVDMLCYSSFDDHATNVANYDKLTRERQKILKEYYENNQSKDVASWLGIAELKIVKLGIKIANNRIAIVNNINQNQLANNNFPEFTTKMSGVLEQEILSKCDADNCEKRYAEEMLARRQKDFFTKMTTIGPNRSDWSVFHLGNNIDAAVCSAGEQKMLLSGVFLAFIVHKIQYDTRNLILLLDDVIAHLDRKHRDLLFLHIKNLVKNNQGKVSVWLSGIDKELFSELDEAALFINIQNETIERGKGI